MSRIRYVKPDFWKDEDIAELNYETRLFYIGLWNFADKAGRLPYRPKWLKIEIFPYDNIKIEKILNILATKKNNSTNPFIQIYTVDEKQYIQILKWDDHQKPHHQEPESKIPKPTITIKGTEKGTITIKGSVLDEPTPNQHRTNTEVLKHKEVIKDLNIVLGTTYKENSKKTIEFIKARFAENYTFEDFKTVHRKMKQAWGTDEKMCKYLRPITLYSPKFESYLNMQNIETTKVSNKTVKSMIAGKSWIKKKEIIDVEQG